MGGIDGSVIGQFLLQMVALIFSLSVHESAHAWMSNRFGDDLADLQGRISLNPARTSILSGPYCFPRSPFSRTLRDWLGESRRRESLRWRISELQIFGCLHRGVICNFIIAIVAGIAIDCCLKSNVYELATWLSSLRYPTVLRYSQ
jgi:hypothetical protein